MKYLIIQYILKRLSETSTIRGIVLTLSSMAGFTLSPDQANATVWIVLGLVGLIGTFIPDQIFKKSNSDHSIFQGPQEYIDKDNSNSPISQEHLGWNNK